MGKQYRVKTMTGEGNPIFMGKTFGGGYEYDFDTEQPRSNGINQDLYCLSPDVTSWAQLPSGGLTFGSSADKPQKPSEQDVDNVFPYNNASDLFAVNFGDGTLVGQPLLVVKGRRGMFSNNSYVGNTGVKGRGCQLVIEIYKRVYESEQLFTDTRIANQRGKTCDVFVSGDDIIDAETYVNLFYKPADDPDDPPQLVVGVFSRTKVVVSDQTHGGYAWCSKEEVWMPDMEAFKTEFGRYIPDGTPAEDPRFGPSSAPGGYGYTGEGGIPGIGSFNFTSDLLQREVKPEQSAISAGMFNVYKVSTDDLQEIGEALFPKPAVTDLSTATTIPDFLAGIAKALDTMSDNLWNGKLIDYIIDCHIMPCPINIPEGQTGVLRCGGKILMKPTTHAPYTLGLVTSNFAYVDYTCGTIHTDPVYGNFLDNIASCKLYIPLYGYVDLPPEYWCNATIGLDYRFNVIDGSFVATVTCRSGFADYASEGMTIVGQYCGCAAVHIPIRGQDYSQIVASLTMAGVGVATGVGGGALSAVKASQGSNMAIASAVSGKLAIGSKANAAAQMAVRGARDAGAAIGGGLTSGALPFASFADTALSGKPRLVSSGGANSSSAMMMSKKPYLMIEYPVPQFPEGYEKEYGIPLFVRAKLGDYKGMTVASHAILDGIPCTAEEKARIAQGLASGLIFK